jgi:N-acetylglucosaminyl-diphospho-decaprenol L-rhamnosyltransferase
MDAARLSVVIPTHDTRELTLRCLASLGKAMTSGVEVVLVDDGSVDDTGGAVRDRFPTVLVLRHEAALGFTVSANDGLRRAGGDVFLLLNSDTEADEQALPHLVEAFDADPRLGVASPRLLNPDRSTQWSGGPAPTLSWLFLLASGLPAALDRVPGYRRVRPVRSETGGRLDWVTGAAMGIRRQTWDDVGPLDTRFRFYAQDLDFCQRARDAGWRVRLVDGARVVHVGGATIGCRPGSVQGAWHPGLLWSDLLLWAEKRRGRRWALAAARCLALGGHARLVARAAVRPLLPGPRRVDWTRESEAFRLALDEVRRWRSEPHPPGG